jgi:hypothetical protein
MSTDRRQLKGVSTPGPLAAVDRLIRQPGSAGHEGLMPESLTDLERIREILYGSERRDSEKRLVDLEQRMEEHATRMDLEIQSRMEAFENQIKQEVRTLGSEISSEQRRRADALEATGRDLTAAMDKLEQKMSSLVNRTAEIERAIHEQLSAEVKSLTEQIRAGQADVNETIQRTVQDLREETVDWVGFADSLRNMAKQVPTRRSRRDGSALYSE